MSTKEVKEVDVWGKLGDKLDLAVFKAKIEALRDHFKSIRGSKTAFPEHDVRDVDLALRLYDEILKNPVSPNMKKVNAMLAALPNTISAKPILGDCEVQIHLGLGYTYRDYSGLVSDKEKEIKEMVKVFPVQVFKVAPTVAADPWRDVVVTKFKAKEISLNDRQFRNGIYTRCPGVALVWGGTVEPCPHDDQVRIKDQPRHHCDSCGKKLVTARAKMRKKGHVAGAGANNKKMLDDLLKRLD